ncbi:tetratricopeptide repeat protein [Barnesiella propionica]|uniref:tetratricopeptide repeat protein n=1 Tax=Barnesiella propionica TaxID=2981781 RepID=UPI0011CC20F7|nr:tetratricopeptide repeat protein [Barnesiella propionica]MCU6768975.1 tetratricopeptide repeat protein [Barnesiella propionica]
MAKKQTDELDKVNEALSNSEQFIQKYQNPILVVVLAIVLVVSGYLAIRHFYIIPREDKAQAAMYQAILAFEKDSFNLAIKGNENFSGLEFIADEYSSTKAGNLANAYLGLSYCALKDYSKAKDYLSKYSGNETIVAPAVKAAIGDCLVNMGKFDESVSYFENAAKESNDDVFSPIYLQKAGTVYEKLGQYQKAADVYQSIKDKHPASSAAQGIERYIERAKSKIK